MKPMATTSRFAARKTPACQVSPVIELPDETSARREEARIKRLSRPEKLALTRVHAPVLEPAVGARRAAAKRGAAS